MKKMLSILLILTFLGNFITVSVFAYDDQEYYKENYSEYVDAMYEAFDSGYINFYDESNLYESMENIRELAVLEMLTQCWEQFSLNNDIAENLRNKYSSTYHLVYEKDLISNVIKFKFNLDLDYLLSIIKNSNYSPSVIEENGYILIAAFGRGESWPGARMVIDELDEINSNMVYTKYHFENPHDDYTDRSENIYAILQKGSIEGKTVVAYEYLSSNPPSDEILSVYSENKNDTPWETGKYEEIITIGDCIYYNGPYYKEDGSIDGIYTICRYNKKNREDKALVYRGYNLQRIGDKLWMLSGVSSGSWDRNLLCCDLDGENLKLITNGFDMRIAFDDNLDSPYTVFNNRLYVGHNPDMEHYEVISCNLNGEDIRTEVSPVYSTDSDCQLYETYAVIDGITYYYNYNNDNITVTLNDKEIEFDQQPIIVDDRTLVPMRAILEAMGCTVEWNAMQQEINVCNNNKQIIQMHIGSNSMWTEVKSDIYLDVPPQIINDRTLIPIRAISESMGAKVFWHSDSNTVDIIYYPPYSGTTIWEYYYRRQNDIINFGHFIDDNPHYADECAYAYTYDSEFDIDFSIEQYLRAMENEGFKVDYLKDENGCIHYDIESKNHKITLIKDYLLRHVEIYIDRGE